MPEEGTRVISEDIQTGEREERIIKNSYVLICDGDYYLDGIQMYGNGTVQLTIKKGKPEDES